MEIRRLGLTDPVSYAEQVARIHAAEIRLGALPLLGERFLARLYRGMSGAPLTGVWVAEESGAVLGFLAGCADIKGTYRSVLTHGAIPLGWQVLRAVVGRPSLLRKVYAVATYPSSEAQKETGAASSSVAMPARHAELLSMAVRRDAQRRGIGRRLVAAFEEALPAWGVTDGYWVTTNRAEPDSNRFYRAMGCEERGTVPHHDLILQQYFRRIAAGSASAKTPSSPGD